MVIQAVGQIFELAEAVNRGRSIVAKTLARRGRTQAGVRFTIAVLRTLVRGLFDSWDTGTRDASKVVVALKVNATRLSRFEAEDLTANVLGANKARLTGVNTISAGCAFDGGCLAKIQIVTKGTLHTRLQAGGAGATDGCALAEGVFANTTDAVRVGAARVARVVQFSASGINAGEDTRSIRCWAAVEIAVTALSKGIGLARP